MLWASNSCNVPKMLPLHWIPRKCQPCLVLPCWMSEHPTLMLRRGGNILQSTDENTFSAAEAALSALPTFYLWNAEHFRLSITPRWGVLTWFWPNFFKLYDYLTYLCQQKGGLQFAHICIAVQPLFMCSLPAERSSCQTALSPSYRLAADGTIFRSCDRSHDHPSFSPLTHSKLDRKGLTTFQVSKKIKQTHTGTAIVCPSTILKWHPDSGILLYLSQLLGFRSFYRSLHNRRKCKHNAPLQCWHPECSDVRALPVDRLRQSCYSRNKSLL